ncbi:MAG: orotate phosphoribosyltransferase [Armatimonadota bacterium]|nr:orotate phosphoribosyltransferase [Armatimonadota bacterium]MDR7450595.1 orotate phosphoribosyltransferase [Armatimonadota bacterium]MDR7466272.1 orotate phosphoribosyltransferase [Armatimonadota bacterium]MDR7492993.1 orotate phosphoribosyltransferase [Armatimonadota bacterium]MDR7498250.1 orotate phosphoribosyltransferase [Armatimonadota bacterium]
MTPDEVLRILEAAGAVRRGHFLLTSGRHSDLFVLCAQVLQYPEQAARLAGAMAEPYARTRIDVVIGPAVGGIILAHEVARRLGARAVFAEKGGAEGMVLRRGFVLRRGERVLAVEDALTTGGSLRRVLELVRAAEAEIVGASVLVDRSGGRLDLGVPVRALLTLDVKAWEPEHCPLCRAGVALIEPKEPV